MRRPLYFLFLFTLFFFAAQAVVFASATNGTIGPNDTLPCTTANIAVNHCTALLIGNPTTTADDAYINFGRYTDPTTSAAVGVHVTNTELTGFAFGETVGWINFNCDANGGSNCASSGYFKVTNDGTGVLSGYAFGQNTGWISFNCDANGGSNCAASGHFKVTIDSNGNFNGYAWSQNYGYIKFDCSPSGQAAGACVNTDWRFGNVTTGTTTGGSGVAGAGVASTGSGTAGTAGTTTTSGTTTTTGTTSATSSTSTTTTSTTGSPTTSTTSTSTTTGVTGSSSTTGSTSGTAGSTTSTTGTAGSGATGLGTGTFSTGTTSGSTTGTSAGSTGSSSTGGSTSGGASGSSGGGSGGGIITTLGTLIQNTSNTITHVLSTLILPQLSSTAQNIVNTTARTVTAVGAAVGVGTTLVSALAINPLSFADLASLPLRLWSLLLAFLGLRKRPWGVVYDSVTKQPLDPVYVILKDAAGNEAGTSITDLDGRYGFLAKAGTYTLTAGKTNYTFPSTKLTGRTSDEVYPDLYFGTPITIATDGEVIAKNIPMDPIKFDWNEYAKRDQKLMTFYTKRTKLFAKITSWVFYIGFIISTLAVISNSSAYNIGIFALYIIIALLRQVGLKSQSFGGIVEKATGFVVPFAIVRIYSAATQVEIAHKIADQTGRYYALISNGNYYVTIEKKNLDGTYTKMLTTAPFTVTNGIINTMFEI